LSHPIGILSGSAVIIYFLYRKKFRAVLIAFGTWTLMILPWMFRNYIVFGDATLGLGVPIPRGIQISLGLISPNSVNFGGAEIGTVVGIAPSETLVGMISEFARLYGMPFFVLFIAFSVIAYLSFPAIKKSLSSSLKKLYAIAGVIIYLEAIGLVISYGGLTSQLVVLFLVPLAVYMYIKFFSRSRDIFTSNSNEIYCVLAVFVVLNLIYYLMYSQTTGRVVPESRFIAFSLFMLIPVAIVGIKKLLKIFFALIVRCLSLRSKISGLSLLSILLIFSLTQTYTGISAINSFQSRFAETVAMKNLHQWIAQNIPEDSKIATNLPHAALLRTGHEAVIFPQTYVGDVPYERWIITKFDIDYLVFYFSGTGNKLFILNTDLGNIELEQVYQSGGALVYEVNEFDR
jgi:hypothetical protein